MTKCIHSIAVLVPPSSASEFMYYSTIGILCIDNTSTKLWCTITYKCSAGSGTPVYSTYMQNPGSESISMIPIFSLFCNNTMV